MRVCMWFFSGIAPSIRVAEIDRRRPARKSGCNTQCRISGSLDGVFIAHLDVYMWVWSLCFGLPTNIHNMHNGIIYAIPLMLANAQIQRQPATKIYWSVLCSTLRVKQGVLMLFDVCCLCMLSLMCGCSSIHYQYWGGEVVMW